MQRRAGSVKRKPGSRMRKVNELMREVVADEVSKLKDPRLGFVTVTDVRTSPDLRSAIVYLSVLDRSEAEDSLLALDAAAGRIQNAVASQSRLKYTPVLSFAIDEALEYGLRISQVIQELSEPGSHGGDTSSGIVGNRYRPAERDND